MTQPLHHARRGRTSLRATVIGASLAVLVTAPVVIGTSASAQETSSAAHHNRVSGRNLVVNGDFENGEVNWRAGRGAQLTIAKHLKSNAHYARLTTGQRQTATLRTRGDDVRQTNAGDTYRLSARMRTNRPTLHGVFRAVETKGTQTQVSRHSFVLSSKSWKTVAFNVTTKYGEGRLKSEVSALSLPKGTTYSVDGFSVTKLAAPAATTVPSPAPAGMRYGVSATSGDFVTGYNAQVKILGASVGYLYGKNPRGADFAGIDQSQDLWLQTKATTRADYDAMLASFPRQRTGRVFLHYHNEPEDNIASGSLSMKDWQNRTDALYAAIDAAHLPYVVKSVEVMYYTLQQTNKGTTNPARQLSNYLRPGVRQVGFSAYAEKKLVNGHEVATVDPVKMPATIKAWASTAHLPFSIVTGWAIDSALLSDPISLANRRQWLRVVGPNLQSAGAQHLMWFDIPWSNGDYRIETDPGLLEVWRSLVAG